MSVKGREEGKGQRQAEEKCRSRQAKKKAAHLSGDRSVLALFCERDYSIAYSAGNVKTQATLFCLKIENM